MDINEFHTYSAAWLKSLNNSCNTRDAYGRDIKKFGTYLSNNQIGLIHDQVIWLYFYHLNETGLSAASMQRHKSCLKGFLKYAGKESLLDKFATLPVGKVNQTVKTIPIPQQEIKRLISTAQLVEQGRFVLWVRDIAMLHLLYNAKLRISELIGLKLSDVDLLNESLQVRGRMTRWVALDGDTYQALGRWIGERALWGAADDSLFISLKTKHGLKRNAVSLRIKAQARKKKLSSNIHAKALSLSGLQHQSC